MDTTLDWARLGRRGLAVLGGGLMGYIAGFILGWSVLDKNTDLWALLAAVGALVGVLYGMRQAFWEHAGQELGAVIGLYLGWVARTLIFGDTPGGLGLVLVIVSAVVGAWIGRGWRVSPGMFFGVLFGGFFGGFLLGVVLGLRLNAEVVGFAPAVAASAVVCAGAVWLLEKRGGSKKL